MGKLVEIFATVHLVFTFQAASVYGKALGSA
jgi:hypothetical protein